MVVVVSVQMMQVHVHVQVPRVVRLAMATLLSLPLLPPVLILAPTLLLLLLRMAPLPTFVWMVS